MSYVYDSPGTLFLSLKKLMWGTMSSMLFLKISEFYSDVTSMTAYNLNWISGWKEIVIKVLVSLVSYLR